MTSNPWMVVKLGGSLQRDPWLPRWLAALTRAGCPVCVVPGGGAFADQVRVAQAHWRFDDLAAHNMAVLAMAQAGQLMCGLNSALKPAAREGDIGPILRAGGTPVWLALDLLRERADELTTWDASSDSLALRLALRLEAARLVVVKSCAVDAGLSLARLSEQGVLDRRFPAMAAEATMPIRVIERGALGEFEAELANVS